MNKPNILGEANRKKIMEYLLQHVEPIAPLSYQDIADGTGIASTNTVAHHLGILQKQNKIKLLGVRNIRVNE